MMFAAWFERLQKRLPLALRSAGEVVVAAARDNVPEKSGALRESLTVETVGESVQIASNLPYALRVEMHTPFLQPALRGQQQAVLETLKETLHE